MNEQAFKQLETLASKLGTTVEYLWGILVKQGRYEGAGIIVACFVVALVLGVLFPLAKKCYLKARRKNMYTALYLSFFTVYVFLCMIAAIAIPVGLYEAYTALVNPEYWALMKIIDCVK